MVADMSRLWVHGKPSGTLHRKHGRELGYAGRLRETRGSSENLTLLGANW